MTGTCCTESGWGGGRLGAFAYGYEDAVSDVEAVVDLNGQVLFLADRDDDMPDSACGKALTHEWAREVLENYRIECELAATPRPPTQATLLQEPA